MILNNHNSYVIVLCLRTLNHRKQNKQLTPAVSSGAKHRHLEGQLSSIIRTRKLRPITIHSQTPTVFTRRLLLPLTTQYSPQRSYFRRVIQIVKFTAAGQNCPDAWTICKQNEPAKFCIITNITGTASKQVNASSSSLQGA